MDLPQTEKEQDKYEQDRRAKLASIRALGLDPFGGDMQSGAGYHVSVNIAYYAKDTSKTPQDGRVMRGRGRIILRREMGNLHFLTIRDDYGQIQIALNKKMLSATNWALAKLLDLGDLIAFEGRCAPTQKGEPTCWVTDYSISAKSLTPPPSKAEGMTDIELRYRRRYVDLWSNPTAMDTLKKRSDITHSLRKTLHTHGFIEVETPIMQAIPGGAVAKPFETHHNALDIPLYLRVAPELFLKRLLVGGMSCIYELGRNFRNEGLSPRHNPEFTALEVYMAYGDFQQMMEVAEDLVLDCAYEIENDYIPEAPWRRVRMDDLVREFSENGDIKFLIQTPDPEDFHKFYEEHVEKTLIAPTFVTHLPASAVPLSKNDGKGYALMWELVANGHEIGCGYTEQSNPDAQLEAFEKQGGDIDWDFIHAMKVGMPPAGGLGIGVDRLVMWLTGQKSIREVIAFPTMKPTE